DSNMLGQLTRKIWRKARRLMEPTPGALLPLSPPLPLPTGATESELRAYLESVRPEHAPAEEMVRYCTEDFRRFVYTLGLARAWSWEPTPTSRRCCCAASAPPTGRWPTTSDQTTASVGA